LIAVKFAKPTLDERITKIESPKDSLANKDNQSVGTEQQYISQRYKELLQRRTKMQTLIGKDLKVCEDSLSCQTEKQNEKIEAILSNSNLEKSQI